MVFNKKDKKDKNKTKDIDSPLINNEKEETKNKIKDYSDKGINTQDKAFAYDILLWDVSENTSVALPIFGANRVYDGKNVFLYNEKIGFKEPIPENNDEYRQHKLEEIEDSIKDIEKQIKKVREGKLNWSLKDLKKDLRIYNNFKRSLLLNGSGSYQTFNSNGKRMYMFDRRGDLKLPLFKNTDISTMYIPSEQKTQEVMQLLKENKDKNGEEHRVTLATYGLIIFLGLLAIGFGFVMWKVTGIPLDVGQQLADVATTLADVTKDLNSVTDSMNNITTNIEGSSPDLNTSPNNQVINGR